jgi:hypothetical protein
MSHPRIRTARRGMSLYTDLHFSMPTRTSGEERETVFVPRCQAEMSAAFCVGENRPMGS